MADLTDEILALSPRPTVVLDSSLCIQRYSQSFLEGLWVTNIVCTSEKLRIQAIIEAATKTKEVQHAIAETGRKDEIHAIPIVKNGVLLYLILEWQLSREKEEEVKLNNTGLSTAEAFQLLLSAVQDYAIFLLDTKGNVRTWNAGAELIKGYRGHEIIGKSFSAFYGEEDLRDNKPSKELEICVRDGRVEDEGWRYRKDGSRFWANVVITAIFHRGVHVGFGKVTRDLTERKKAEAQLIATYEKSSKLKSDFLASMSHEIRTPMHGMLSAGNLLFDTTLTDEQRDLSDIIHDSGEILLQLTNDILDYSKLTAGSFSLNSGQVEVAHSVKSVTRNFQAVLRPGVQFELVLSPYLPIAATGDPLRYRQVLQNLIGNAVKFTEHGFIRIHALVTKETDDHYLIFTDVKDTGKGVPDTARNALFTPFRQFHDSTSTFCSGTGLGLSISKSLVELMGGHIGFTKNPGCQGSIFWFTVLLKKIQSSDEALSSQRQCLQSAYQNNSYLKRLFETKDILLVEDNILNQNVMLRMLRSLGFQKIDTAVNGVQALHSVGSGKAYSVILMDIAMPIMDGITATCEIRRQGVLTPILALTANALEGDRESYLGIGMNDYIPKPVNKDFLARILTKWLECEPPFTLEPSRKLGQD